MADEDLASVEEAEAQTLAPETDGETAVEPTTPDPIEALASELGWKPQDQYSGDNWKPAADFIKAGREIQHSYARDIKSMREQMDRMSGVTTQLLEDKGKERDAYWQQQLNQAVEDGDTARVTQLVEQRPVQQAQQQPGLAPEATTWIGKNEWFNKDPLAQARAIEICERLKHLPVAEQLAQAERGIRKEFPEHFAPPAKQPPATQTGQNRNPNPSNRAKGFAEMPAESQAMARDMVRRNPGLTLEAIAKSFWSQETTQRRA